MAKQRKKRTHPRHPPKAWYVAVQKSDGTAWAAWLGDRLRPYSKENVQQYCVEEATSAREAMEEGERRWKLANEIVGVVAPSDAGAGQQPFGITADMTPEQRQAAVSEGMRLGFELADTVRKLVKRHGYELIRDMVAVWAPTEGS